MKSWLTPDGRWLCTVGGEGPEAELYTAITCETLRSWREFHDWAIKTLVEGRRDGRLNPTHIYRWVQARETMSGRAGELARMLPPAWHIDWAEVAHYFEREYRTIIEQLVEQRKAKAWPPEGAGVIY